MACNKKNEPRPDPEIFIGEGSPPPAIPVELDYLLSKEFGLFTETQAVLIPIIEWFMQEWSGGRVLQTGALAAAILNAYGLDLDTKGEGGKTSIHSRLSRQLSAISGTSERVKRFIVYGPEIHNARTGQKQRMRNWQCLDAKRDTRDFIASRRRRSPTHAAQVAEYRRRIQELQTDLAEYKDLCDVQCREIEELGAKVKELLAKLQEYESGAVDNQKTSLVPMRGYVKTGCPTCNGQTYVYQERK